MNALDWPQGGTSMPIRDYASLRMAIKARRIQLGISTLALDEMAGLQNGYVTKIENGIKNFGPMSLDAVLGALGLAIELVPYKIPKGELKSEASQRLADLFSLKGAKGGRAAARALTPKQLRARARKAGLASGLSRKRRARLAKSSRSQGRLERVEP